MRSLKSIVSSALDYYRKVGTVAWPPPNSPFHLGTTILTPRARDVLEKSSEGLQQYLDRHSSGDWGLNGSLAETNKNLSDNHDGYKTGEREVISRYLLTSGKEIIIVTTCGRSATVVLAMQDSPPWEQMQELGIKPIDLGEMVYHETQGGKLPPQEEMNSYLEKHATGKWEFPDWGSLETHGATNLANLASGGEYVWSSYLTSQGMRCTIAGPMFGRENHRGTWDIIPAPKLPMYDMPRKKKR